MDRDCHPDGLKWVERRPSSSEGHRIDSLQWFHIPDKLVFVKIWYRCLLLVLLCAMSMEGPPVIRITRMLKADGISWQCFLCFGHESMDDFTPRMVTSFGLIWYDIELMPQFGSSVLSRSESVCRSPCSMWLMGTAIDEPMLVGHGCNRKASRYDLNYFLIPPVSYLDWSIQILFEGKIICGAIYQRFSATTPRATCGVNVGREVRLPDLKVCVAGRRMNTTW